MREILFRGFTPDENGRETITVSGKQIKGEWVQGSYWELRETTYCFQSDYDMHPDNTKHYIVFDRMTDWGLPNRHLQADVIPETVGQFTGLTDKNGKKIFEGDILEYRSDIVSLGSGYKTGAVEVSHRVVEWGEYGWIYKEISNNRWNSSWNNYGRKDHLYKKNVFEFATVIGNIHDNPELLKNEHPAIL